MSYLTRCCILLLTVSISNSLIEASIRFVDPVFGELVPSDQYPGFLTDPNFKESVLVLASKSELEAINSTANGINRQRRQVRDSCAEFGGIRDCLRHFVTREFYTEKAPVLSDIDAPEIVAEKLTSRPSFRPCIFQAHANVWRYVKDGLNKRLVKLMGTSRLSQAQALSEKILDCSFKVKSVGRNFDIDDKAQLSINERDAARVWVAANLREFIVSQFEIYVVHDEQSSTLSTTTKSGSTEPVLDADEDEVTTMTIHTTEATSVTESIMKGREFVFTWLKSMLISDSSQLFFTVINDNKEPVAVSWVSSENKRKTELTVQSEGYLKINVPLTLQATYNRSQMGWTTDERIAIFVTSSDDVSILAWNVCDGGENRETSADAFSVLPVRNLGSKYVAGAGSSSLLHLRFGKERPRQIAFIGTQDWTTVLFNDNTGKPYSRTLLKYDVMSFRTLEEDNLNGFRITSSPDKPVAVVSGAQCKFADISAQACDSMSEMLIPVKHWGTRFPLAPMGDLSRLQFYHIQVLASENSTELLLDGAKEAVIGIGKTHEFYLIGRRKERFLESNKPVSVWMNGYRGYGILIPPLEHYLSSSVSFYTPSGLNLYTNKITVLSNTNRLALDHQTLASESWNGIGNSNFSHVSVPVSPGFHKVRCTGENCRFTVLVYGHHHWRGYGYVAGLCFQ